MKFRLYFNCRNCKDMYKINEVTCSANSHTIVSEMNTKKVYKAVEYFVLNMKNLIKLPSFSSLLSLLSAEVVLFTLFLEAALSSLFLDCLVHNKFR